MNISKNVKKGFTLVELLVVVAIIAVIGAGVAVTYRNMTDKAETAMEMSDCAILTKTISHWSAINDGDLPNGLDLLVDTDMKLYSVMEMSNDPESSMEMTGAETEINGKHGVSGPIGYTMMLADAKTPILNALNSAGMTYGFLHDAKATVANDSTFTTGMFGGDVSTNSTLLNLTNLPAARVEAAQTILDAKPTNPDAPVSEENKVVIEWPTAVQKKPSSKAGFEDSYSTPESFAAAQKKAKDIFYARTPSGEIKLAFVYPGGGLDMGVTTPMGQMKGTGPMNFTQDIITNAGMRPEEIANPNAPGVWVKNPMTGAVSYKRPVNHEAEKYFLVVMGLGRFSSIYGGKSVRVDAPAYGKRSGQSSSIYNRYLAVVRIPIDGYDSMTGAGEKPSVVAVLTPQGYSAASLRDKYIQDEKNLKD